MNLTTTIVRVEERPTTTMGRSLWRITDADRVRYATTNTWLASLAEEYRKNGTPVRMHSSGGWYYRELTGIVPADQAGVA